VAKPLEKQSSHTQIKICGFTCANDAVAACDLGADSIGLVFYPPSGRNVTVRQAREIVSSLPPFVVVTGLFLNAEEAFVKEVLADVPLSMLQFHGTEDADYCRSFQRPYMKSVAMKSIANDSIEGLNTYCDGYSDARGFLLDSNAAGAAGGSGETFDWNMVPQSLVAPVILAGGLDASML